MYVSLRAPKVYVPNKSYHDFRSAERFGELIFLTEGIVKRFNTNDITRQCYEMMKDAQPNDYVLISGLSIINSIACAIFARRFGRINVLLHDPKSGDYRSRSVVIDDKEVDLHGRTDSASAEHPSAPRSDHSRGNKDLPTDDHEVRSRGMDRSVPRQRDRSED